MPFRFEDHDPETYRRKARFVAVAMAAQFIVFGVVFAQLLTANFGSSLWLNALGVFLGLLATSLVFAVLRERPWMADMRYAWQLKHHLARLSSHLSTLRRAVEEGDDVALHLLTSYHQGMAQLAELDGRTLDDDSERAAERVWVRGLRRDRGLPERVEGFDPEELRAFRQR
ncbi:DUF3087 family protein [Billgrantia azerbaijanica]|nr:DUF3087 family protein [Halomonas azerbaijanica]